MKSPRYTFPLLRTLAHVLTRILFALMFILAPLQAVANAHEPHVHVQIANWDQMVEYVTQLFLEVTLSLSTDLTADFEQEQLAALEWHWGMREAQPGTPVELDYSTPLAYIRGALETGQKIDDRILILTAFGEILTPARSTVEDVPTPAQPFKVSQPGI